MKNPSVLFLAFVAATTTACATSTPYVDVQHANDRMANERIAYEEPEPLATPIPIVQESQTPASGSITDTPGPIAPTYTRTLIRMPLAHVPTSAADAEFERLAVRRRVRGGLLLGFSSPLFVTGGLALSAVARGVTGPFYVLALFGGTVMVGGGLGMAIPGIIFLTTDPKLPQNQAQYRPKLNVSPTGLSLSGTF